MIAFTANALLTPDERIARPVVIVEGGIISEMFSRDSQELPSRVKEIRLDESFHGATVAPAFIDMHIHGGAGHDVMRDDAAGRARMEQMLTRHGVGSYFPTTVTASMDATLTALSQMADAIENSEKSPAPGRAMPLGIHLEGPFISHARRGVHPPADLMLPTLATFDRFWQASRGRIRIMTIAPELQGALEVIAEAANHGVCVSLGHSDASLDEAHAAVNAGARHATHTFNAMRPLDHRDPGILGEVLTNTNLSADIIADGIHLDPAIVRLFLQAKGSDSAVLITDAISATGMPDGKYKLGNIEVEVSDGKCTAEGKLAGSVLTMDRAVRNVMQFAGWNLQQTVKLATANPARVMKLKSRGRIAAGASADFVLLSSAGDVMRTIIAGQYE
jgi:N-acetylglucosamine-6-phosphate deacetylase